MKNTQKKINFNNKNLIITKNYQKLKNAHFHKKAATLCDYFKLNIYIILLNLF